MTSLTYQNIVNLIRQVATLVNPDGWFEHARKWDFSLSYDQADPQILLYPFTIKGKESRSSELLIGFFKQDTPETTPEQREAIIAEMDILARAFIESLDTNESIELLNYQSEPAYRQFAGTYSGYLVRFTLNGFLDCEDNPIPSTCPSLCELIELAAEEDLGGNAISDAIASLTARIKADATNNRASVVFKAISLNNDAYSFEFSYQVK